MATIQGVEPIQNTQFGPTKKLPKTCEKRFYKHIQVVLRKKRLEETANTEKMRTVLKLPKMATMEGL